MRPRGLRQRQGVGHRHALRHEPALGAGGEGHGGEERLECGDGEIEPGKALPFRSPRHRHRLLEARHLHLVHEAGMVVLVAGKGEAEALDGVGDEAGGKVVGDAMEGLQHGRHVVPREIGHDGVEARIIMRGEKSADAGEMAEIALEMLPPAFAALEDQCGIERVGAGIDPLPERLAIGRGERSLELLAVFQRHHPPAHGAEEAVDAVEEAVRDDAVEALAVVVDNPPEVPHIVLPALEHRLEDIALVEFGVAHHRHHAPGGLRLRREALEAHIVLHQRGKAGDGDAQPDRTRGEIDVAAILGARRIGLRATQRAKGLELLTLLPPQQVLEGVIDRARMRLHRDAVLGPQHIEIKCRHQRHDRGARGLMAADLKPIPARPQVIGVMDHPRRQPEHFPLQRLQQDEPVGLSAGLRAGERRRCGQPGLLGLAAEYRRCARSGRTVAGFGKKMRMIGDDGGSRGMTGHDGDDFRLRNATLLCPRKQANPHLLNLFSQTTRSG